MRALWSGFKVAPFDGIGYGEPDAAAVQVRPGQAGTRTGAGGQPLGGIETGRGLAQSMAAWIRHPDVLADLVDGPLAASFEALQRVLAPPLPAPSTAAMGVSQTTSASTAVSSVAGAVPSLGPASAASLGPDPVAVALVPVLAAPLTADEAVQLRKRQLEDDQRAERERAALKKKKKPLL